MLISEDVTEGFPDCLLPFKRIENSSEIKGSSTSNVVGKNLLPAIPCADAFSGTRSISDKAKPSELSRQAISIEPPEKDQLGAHFFIAFPFMDSIIAEPPYFYINRKNADGLSNF